MAIDGNDIFVLVSKDVLEFGQDSLNVTGLGDFWNLAVLHVAGADKSVQFLIASDSKLQVTRRNTLDLQILGGVASELEDFGGEIFEDGGNVDGSFGAHAHLVLGLRLQEALDTTARELS